MRNAEIADALAELATLYELDGAIRYRVLAYREAARVIRQSPVSVEELAREPAGPPSCPASARRSRRRSSRWSTTGEIPSAAKLKRKFPPSLVEVTRVPGVGAKTARRLFDELGVASLEDLQRRGRAGADPRAQGPRPEGRGERARVARQARRPRAGRAAAALGGAAGRRAARSRPARPPGKRRGRGRRLGPAVDRDLQGHRPDRHRQRAGGAGAGAARPSAGGDQGLVRRRAGPGSPPTTGSRSTCGSSPPRPTATCSSTSPARPSTTSSCASARVQMGLSVSEHGITDTETGEVARYATEAEVYERLGLAYIEPELREGRGEIAAAADGELPDAGRARGHPRRPALPHDPLRRPQHARGDGRGGAGPRLRLPRRSPTTRPATASATTSPPKRLRERIEEVRGAERRAGAASGCSPARRSTSCPTARSTTTDELLGRARLGDRQRPHLVPDLRRGDDRARARGDREPARRLHRPPHRAPDRQARALRHRRRAGRRGRGRAPARCSRSTATRTAATSPSATPGSPPRPA